MQPDNVLAEKEANIFAYAFLMPEAHFRDCWAKCNGDVTSVAREFMVLETHVETRAKMLGIVKEISDARS